MGHRLNIYSLVLMYEYFLNLIWWWDSYTLTYSIAANMQLGIEFYLFVSHEGMKRQRFHV